jgi:alpha-N-arabinofuranosidase
MRISLSIIYVLVTSSLYGQQTRVTNPILPGFYPDPSIEKVDTTYYMVHSTFAYMPGIPVFKGYDLKNWVQIGNVIDRDTQLDFRGERVSRGLFAPTISHHRNTYYVTCTDIDNIGNFVVTATDPAGPWSDIVELPEIKGIDPSLFFDTENDRAYIVYNSAAPNDQPLYEGHRTIRMYEFDYTNLRVVGEERLLVNGGVDISKHPVWIEGPHIYKRGDYFYLCAAEGGTSVRHSQVIFRSKSIDGPYLPWEKNPILTQRDLDPLREFPITSTGHADLTEGPDGHTYAVFLATRPYADNHYNIGRETFVAPVEWTTNGWPIINPHHDDVKYSYNFPWPEHPISGAAQNGNFSYHYDFPKDSIDHSFLFLRKKDSDWYQMTADGLVLSLESTTLSQYDNPAYIARRLQHHQAAISTSVLFEPQTHYESAGLAVFQGEKNYYYIAITRHEQQKYIALYKSEGDHTVLLQQTSITSHHPIELKAEADKDVYRFYYRHSDTSWSLLSTQDGRHLSTETAGGFVGTTFGPYATANGQISTNTATFTQLTYIGYDDVYENH